MASHDEKVVQPDIFHNEHINSSTPHHSHTVRAELAAHGEVAEEAIGGTFEDLPPGYYRSFAFIGTMLAAYLQYCAVYTGFTIPANVLPIINADIGPDPNYSWIAIVWSLTSAVSFALLGRLSDIFGRRWFFIAGAIFGLVGSIIASTAQTVPTIIGGTALLGIAAGSQISYATVFSELLPNRYRSLAIGGIALANTPLAIFGSIIIRLWIERTDAGWRWTYYVGIILNAVSIVLYYLCYHPPTFHLLHAKGRHISRWKMIDYIGTFSFTLGLLMLLLGLSWGGSIYPWKSGMVIGFMVSGFVTLAGFTFYEIYGAGEYALIPMRLFLNRGFSGIVVTSGIAFMVYISLTILFPVQLTLLYAKSSLDIGWKSCIIQVGAIGGDFLGGILLKLFGKHKYQMLIYTIMLCAFTAAMAATTPQTEGMALGFAFLASLAVGFLGNASLSLTPFCLKEEDIGLALGMIGTSRAVFGAIGQAIFVAVLNSGLEKNVPKYVGPAAVDAGLPQDDIPALLAGLAIGNFTNVPDITPGIVTAAVTANKIAYSQSFKVVFLSSIAFGGISILAALMVPNLEDKFTGEISRRLTAKEKNHTVIDTKGHGGDDKV